MTDLEKVIMGLSRHGNSDCEYDKETMCPYWGESHCSSHLCLDALALLKEQAPIKVDPILFGTNGVKKGRCPKCGDRIDDYYNMAFCGRCGRAVKWE